MSAMSDRDTPPAGPWGSRDPQADTVAAAVAVPAARPAATAEANKGQHPLWAIGSTLLLGGFIWFVSGSWVIAVAAIWGLFVHEYGHVLAMNRLGMGPARIFIIPFLGGVARSARLPASEWDGVKVSLAGPAFGLLAALPFFGLYLLLGGGAWLIGAAAIAALNLINLAPAPPLDGSKALGPVLARIHPLLERAAMIAVGLLVVVWGLSNGSYIFAGFLVLALYGHLRRGKWRPDGRPLTGREAAYSVGLYVLTALACAAMAVFALSHLTGSIDEALAVGGRYLQVGR